MQFLSGLSPPCVSCPGSGSLSFPRHGSDRAFPAAGIPLVLVLLVAGLMLVHAVSANTYEGGIPLQTEKKGVVSGGLWSDSYPGFATTAQKTFTPPKHTAIQWARLYVGVYCGHKQNNYPGKVTTALDLDGDGNFETPLATETLNVPYSYPGTGGTGPVRVNDHMNRVTSDYLMWYDIGDKITGKPLGASVKTDKLSGSSFDGRIKFIALVIAYDDGDNDKVYYWVNQGHDPLYSDDNNGYYGETTFSTSDLSTLRDGDEENMEASLSALYMASVDGKYTFNTDEMPGGTPAGAYFGTNTWDVRDEIIPGDDSTLKYEEAGTYYKIPLALLTVRIPGRDEGSLEVTSSPPGLPVSLDGEDTRTVTNGTITGVGAGEHKVGILLGGNRTFRQPSEKTVVVTKNAVSRVYFEPDQVNCSARISSTPPGAWIFLDGTNLSVQTDSEIRNIPAGNHTISLRMTGFEDQSSEAVLDSRHPNTIAGILIPAPADAGAARAESNITGEYGYGGRTTTPPLHGTVRGGLLIANATGYSGLLAKGESRTYPVTVPLPAGAKVTDARMYVYTTWGYNTGDLTGRPASIRVDSDDITLPRDAVYMDRKGYGTYDYPAETHCYALDPGTIRGGVRQYTVVNTGKEKDTFAVYGIVVVVVYKDPAGPLTEYWIGEDADLVYANPEFGTDTAAATTRMDIVTENSSQDLPYGALIAISTAASGSTGDNNRILFNDRQWTDPLSGGSSGISIVRLNVSGAIRPGSNTAAIQSLVLSGKGDYMENRNIILYRAGNATTLTAGAREPDAGKSGEGDTAGNGPGNSGGAEPAPAETGPSVQVLDPSANTYAVRVISNPPGAAISLDYRPSGKAAPATIEHVRGGNHTFTLELDGFSPAEQKVAILGNETLTFTLDSRGSASFDRLKIGAGESELLDQERYGGVYVTSNPDGADIYIDGKKTSFVTPGVIYGLNAGKHTVKVTKGSRSSKVGFPVESKDLFIDDGTIAPVSFSVSENPYLLNVSVSSKEFNGYEFTLNGMRTRYRLPATLSLQYSSDNFLTVFSNDSYISMPLVIYNTLDQTQEVRTLSRSFHDLQVESKPSGADIVIDGYSTGYSTPYLIRNLSEGQHVVTITKAGYLPVSSTVWVNSGDVVRRFVMVQYLFGKLRVTSVPEGGKIYINNKDTGETTPFTFQFMSAGNYNIKVVQNKTQAIEESIPVEPFKCREVNLTLKKRGVKYGIRSSES